MTALQKALAFLDDISPWRDSQAQAAVEVGITYVVKNPTVAALKISGRLIRFGPKGKVTVRLRPGRHKLEWRAYGSPLTPYVISIDAPTAYKWKPKVPLSTDSAGYVANSKTITIKKTS